MAVMAIATVAGAVIKSRAQKKATGAMTAANEKAMTQQEKSLAEQKRQFDIGQANMRPYLEAGKTGLANYTAALDRDDLAKWGGFTQEDMQEDPGYKFRLEQGMRSLDRMSASRGQRFSGARGIGLQQYGQDMASQEFGAARGRALQDYRMKRVEGLTRLSQWAGLAASGQQAAGKASDLGAQYASQITGINTNIANSQMYGGRIQAAGYMGQANITSSAISSLAGQYGAYSGGGGNLSGMSGVNMGSQQDTMLAAQNAGF